MPLKVRSSKQVKHLLIYCRFIMKYQCNIDMEQKGAPQHQEPADKEQRNYSKERRTKNKITFKPRINTIDMIYDKDHF